VTNESGYAVNQTEARSSAARGSGCAYGFCHMLPCPESCDASRLASLSIDWSTSHSTYSRLSATASPALSPVSRSEMRRASERRADGRKRRGRAG
jgi:hypothetical protein